MIECPHDPQRFYNLILILLFLFFRKQNNNYEEKGKAIERIVAASNGKLNWALHLPISEWNWVFESADGIEVRLGLSGSTPCHFEFRTKLVLADFVRVFGPALSQLNVNSQKCTGMFNWNFTCAT